MKTILIKEGCPNPINLGEKGENGVSAVLFDYSEWIEDFGNGAISLLVKRKGDSSAYPVVLTTADGIATWIISDTDTAVQGYGKAEYIFTIDDKIAKSAVFSFFVAQDLGEGGDPPDPYESWIDTLTALGGETLINAQRAEAAESGAETAQANAETAATNAATSATNAAQSAGAARDMAASALSSADRATASATAASGHATAAETAKDLAISAAESSQHSETQAELSASAAAESAESASASATTATTAATNASASASSASNSATAASGSASSASASATTASNAATNAAASATSASGSASAAATSESNAAQSATEAEASAQEAATEAAKLNDYLPTDTASGSIASFSDGADGVPVEALSVALEPIQSGSGTPSPDNVRPITGHTQCEVWRSGKNLLPSDKYQQASSVVVLGQNDATSFQLHLAAGTYTVSITCAKVGSFYYRTPDGTASIHIGNYNVTSATFTLTEDSDIRLWFYLSAGVDASEISNTQLEVGSTSSEYEPYTAVHISIPLGQTVYGGSIDVVGGVCTVDRAMVDMGSLSWGAGFGGFHSQSIQSNAKVPVSLGTPTAICSMFPWSTSANECFYIHNATDYAGWLIVRTTSYSDAASFKTAMNGVQLVYELAQPITIDLTDIPTISTLLGQNNVWSDSGDVSVTYRADIQKYIAKVIAEALA